MIPVRILDKIPTDIFTRCKDEIKNINWDSVQDLRKTNSVFSTSTAIHLRVHDAPDGTPHTVKDMSQYVECRDTAFRKEFPNTNTLIECVYNMVTGCKLGRIMIVKLLPGGEITEHIDPGKYFQSYHRFHVPIITNSDVKFFGPNGTNATHMPIGFLSQLNNRQLHSASNKGTDYRVHIIVDIDSKNEKYNF